MTDSKLNDIGVALATKIYIVGRCPKQKRVKPSACNRDCTIN